jgi:hypothetical protein
MKSPKEINLEKELLSMLEGKARMVCELLLKDREIEALQNYANTVSIKRLGFNDHGPVHMKKAAVNAMTMFRILKEKGVLFSIEEDEAGTEEESRIAVLLASYLHDIGMTIGRNSHEIYSSVFALQIMDRILNQVYPDELEKMIVIRSTAMEGIIGHMATQTIHSIEAGIVLIADGCDMERGRARIPMIIHPESKIGDIHKYSASSIEKVIIRAGGDKPLCIEVSMDDNTGLFQIEEVLMKKISLSPAKKYIELIALVKGSEPKKYIL